MADADVSYPYSLADTDIGFNQFLADTDIGFSQNMADTDVGIRHHGVEQRHQSGFARSAPFRHRTHAEQRGAVGTRAHLLNSQPLPRPAPNHVYTATASCACCPLS